MKWATNRILKKVESGAHGRQCTVKKVVKNYKSVCNRFTMINGLIIQVFGKPVAINYGI